MNNTILTTQLQHVSKMHQTGVTLIELMVAMAVSSFILLGISNIYVATKESYVIHDEFARIQENGRFAVETITSNVRNAGYFGCASGQGLGNIINGLNSTNNPAWNFETGLMGYEANDTDVGETKIITPSVQSGDVNDWATAAGLTSGGTAIAVTPDSAIATLAIEGSDILVVRTTKGTGIRLLQNNGSGNIRVQDDGSTGTCSGGDAKLSGLCDNDILLVSDCSNSRIFQATNIVALGSGACDGQSDCLNVVHSAGASPGNAAVTWNPPSNIFTEDAELMKLVTKTFFIGTSGGEPSLYMRENDGTPEPLIEGIENMQILYGVDTDTTPDGIANKYVSADAADDLDLDGDSNTVFDAVVSVKISLLVRTPNNLPGLRRSEADYAELTYDMVSPVSPIVIDPIADDTALTDRRMRKIYTMTIKIRNKSFNTAIEAS